MTAGAWWNHPPNWPPPPPGWSPPPGWAPPLDWPPVPAGWPLWLYSGSPAPAAYPAAYPAPYARQPSRANVGVIIGAAALTVSPFLTWIRVLLIGSLNLFDLTTLNGNNATWFPVLILLIGGVTVVLGVVRSRGAYIGALIIGLLAGIFGLLIMIGLIQGVRADEGLVTVGVGPFIALLGLLTVVIASIVGVVSDSG